MVSTRRDATRKDRSTTHRVDKLDARKIHVVVGEFVDNVGNVDRLGRGVPRDASGGGSGGRPQLRRAEEEGQEVVVVEAPYTVRPRWFKPVCRLENTHNLYVPRGGLAESAGDDGDRDRPPEHANDECFVVPVLDDAEVS